MSSRARRRVAETVADALVDAIAGLAAMRRRGVRRWVLAAVAALGAVGAAAQAPAPDVDVPFVVTPDNVTPAMLELAAVGPADHLIDLGSGNGRIVILAVRRFGATGLGVETSTTSSGAAGLAPRAPASPTASSSAPRTCSRLTRRARP